MQNPEMMESNQRIMDFNPNDPPSWIYDRHTLRFVSVNDAAVNLYGYSREEFLRLTILDIRPMQEIQRVLHHLRDGFASRELSTWTHRKKDGTEFGVQLLFEPITFQNRSAVKVTIHCVYGLDETTPSDSQYSQ